MNVSAHTGALVVRFQTGTDEYGMVRGHRVEHVVASGQLTNFYSRDELMACLERMLKRARGDEHRLTQILLGNSHPTLKLSKGKKRQNHE
jgi:hypothetical protein